MNYLNENSAYKFINNECNGYLDLICESAKDNVKPAIALFDMVIERSKEIRNINVELFTPDEIKEKHLPGFCKFDWNSDTTVFISTAVSGCNQTVNISFMKKNYEEEMIHQLQMGIPNIPIPIANIMVSVGGDTALVIARRQMSNINEDLKRDITNYYLHISELPYYAAELGIFVESE